MGESLLLSEYPTVLNIPMVLMISPHMVHVPNFGGLSRSEDRGGGDNSIQLINFGRVSDKSFQNDDKIRGGGRMGDFSSYSTR